MLRAVPEHRDPAVETKDRAPDARGVCQGAGVGDDVAGREVVRAVHDQVVAADDVHGIVPGQAGTELLHGDRRVDPRDGVRGGLDLRPADVVHAVDDLTLQVGDVHHVIVDDADGAHTRRGEVEQGG